VGAEADAIPILPLFWPSFCKNHWFYRRKARDSAAMLLDSLSQGFARAAVWAVRPDQAPMEGGRAVELPNPIVSA